MSSISHINEDGQPWYREPWPWILFGLPAVVVVASVITFAIAYRGSDELVVDDYYKEGLGINRVLSRNRHALELGLSGEVVVAGGVAKLDLRAKEGVALPSRVRLTFAHATRSELDQTVVLDSSPDGYRGVLHPLLNGRWQVQIEDEAQTWRLAAIVQLPADGGFKVRSLLDSTL